ncbi:MAG: AtpZ/AtpI family protein [Salibacteraceae bacterium]
MGTKRSDSSKPNKPPKPPKNVYAYSGIAAKMIAVILAGVFGGIKLDEVLASEFPLFTLLLSLLSVGLAMYIVIRDLIK